MSLVSPSLSLRAASTYKVGNRSAGRGSMTPPDKPSGASEKLAATRAKSSPFCSCVHACSARAQLGQLPGAGLLGHAHDDVGKLDDLRVLAGLPRRLQIVVDLALGDDDAVLDLALAQP